MTFPTQLPAGVKIGLTGASSTHPQNDAEYPVAPSLKGLQLGRVGVLVPRQPASRAGPLAARPAEQPLGEDAMAGDVTSTTDLFEIVRTTRSMRRLKQDPVPDPASAAASSGSS